jgi:hypothetical protein
MGGYHHHLKLRSRRTNARFLVQNIQEFPRYRHSQFALLFPSDTDAHLDCAILNDSSSASCRSCTSFHRVIDDETNAHFSPLPPSSTVTSCFEFIRERYPLISQLIQDDRIPEFDNLYLDMNGIIHNVSHPDDSASYRIAEEQIFLGVFAYISHLFSVIKPQKLFFLAIDGVAPRAKMNQQRSRRFRTAKEMKEVLDKAKAKGEVIPEGDGFDSNCITPGTPFMARLSAQLKYFIAKKVSEDSDWRGVEIILSGHEVCIPYSLSPHHS